MNDYYAVTYVESEEGEILSFGNLYGRLYPDAHSAWTAIEKDAKKYSTFPENLSLMPDSNHAEYYNPATGYSYTWEIQKMSI